MSTALLLAWVPGIWELVLLLVVVLLLFGSRVPSVMRSLGLGISEFKKGLKEDAPEDKNFLDDKR